jgi:hypothetical protein
MAFCTMKTSQNSQQTAPLPQMTLDLPPRSFAVHPMRCALASSAAHKYQLTTCPVAWRWPLLPVTLKPSHAASPLTASESFAGNLLRAIRGNLAHVYPFQALCKPFDVIPYRVLKIWECEVEHKTRKGPTNSQAVNL